VRCSSSADGGGPHRREGRRRGRRDSSALQLDRDRVPATLDSGSSGVQLLQAPATARHPAQERRKVR
jgi:hypothetical protein